MRTIIGTTFLHSETGTEGGWWAVQEDGFLAEDGIHWKYEGLQYLEEGDHLIIFKDGDYSEVLFDGIIKKDATTNLTAHQIIKNGKIVASPDWNQQVVDGMYVHWLQAGIDPKVWSSFFHHPGKRAVIERSVKVG